MNIQDITQCSLFLNIICIIDTVLKLTAKNQSFDIAMLS